MYVYKCLLIFMCIFCAPDAHGGQKRTSDPHNTCELPCGSREWNPGPLHENHMLRTAEASLQPQNLYFTPYISVSLGSLLTITNTYKFLVKHLGGWGAMTWEKNTWKSCNMEYGEFSQNSRGRKLTTQKISEQNIWIDTLNSMYRRQVRT